MLDIEIKKKEIETNLIVMNNNCQHINTYNICESENFTLNKYYYIDECILCKKKITRFVEIEDMLKEEN